jgi:16S rRNA (cytosine1402-N4)-methyltransferase
MARLIARKIVEARLISEIKTTLELNNLLLSVLPKKRSNKLLAQIYQSLRIEVNSEIDVIKSFLIQTKDVLRQKGRLSVISYHSLEDRLVKRFIRSGLFQGDAKKDIYGNENLPFSKVGKLIVPTYDEIKLNNRARSAKLRIAEKN